jgi:hypothetical protein
LRARDVVQPGDSLRWLIEPESKVLARIEADTALEGEPVKLKTEFAKLASDGLAYAATSTITASKKDTVIQIENYDLQRM